MLYFHSDEVYDLHGCISENIKWISYSKRTIIASLYLTVFSYIHHYQSVHAGCVGDSLVWGGGVADTGCIWKQQWQQLSRWSNGCIHVKWGWLGLIDQWSHDQSITEVLMILNRGNKSTADGKWWRKLWSINEGKCNLKSWPYKK